MSILDDLPDEIAEALDDAFRPATLKIPGTKTGDGQGGYTATASASKTCKALVVDANDYRRAALGIPAQDRLIIVLAATIQDGAIPKNGDTIQAADPLRGWAMTDFLVIKRFGDPAAATYEIQGR